MATLRGDRGTVRSGQERRRRGESDSRPQLGRGALAGEPLFGAANVPARVHVPRRFKRPTLLQAGEIALKRPLAARLGSRLLHDNPALTTEIPSLVRLREALGELLLGVEEEFGAGLVTSILLIDLQGKRLVHGAAPSLPEAYSRAIDGMPTGPSVGACGAAAYLRRPVYVHDLANDPLWGSFKDLAAAHGLRACWSTPVEGPEGEVVATFTVYSPTPRSPSSEEVEAMDLVSRVAALVIERYRIRIGAPALGDAPPRSGRGWP